jgi:hypothetical protein
MQIVEARESTHVLRAEWAYLNRLDRIGELSAMHLGMAAATPDRIVRFDDLPIRPAPPSPALVADSSDAPNGKEQVTRLAGRQLR